MKMTSFSVIRAYIPMHFAINQATQRRVRIGKQRFCHTERNCYDRFS